MVLHVVWKHSQIKVIVAFRIQCPEDDHTSTVNMLTIMSKVRIEAFMWVSQLISIQASLLKNYWHGDKSVDYSHTKQGSALSQQPLSNLNNTIEYWTNSWKNCPIILSNPVSMNTNRLLCNTLIHVIVEFPAKLLYSWLNCFQCIMYIHCLVTYHSITLSIQGAGTAIGELPPYFMARAGNKWRCLIHMYA